MADLLIKVDKQPKPRLLERKISLEIREAGSIIKNKKCLQFKLDVFLIVDSLVPQDFSLSGPSIGGRSKVGSKMPVGHARGQIPEMPAFIYLQYLGIFPFWGESILASFSPSQCSISCT